MQSEATGRHQIGALENDREKSDYFLLENSEINMRNFQLDSEANRKTFLQSQPFTSRFISSNYGDRRIQPQIHSIKCFSGNFWKIKHLFIPKEALNGGLWRPFVLKRTTKLEIMMRNTLNSQQICILKKVLLESRGMDEVIIHIELPHRNEMILKRLMRIMAVYELKLNASLDITAQLDKFDQVNRWSTGYNTTTYLKELKLRFNSNCDTYNISQIEDQANKVAPFCELVSLQKNLHTLYVKFQNSFFFDILSNLVKDSDRRVPIKNFNIFVFISILQRDSFLSFANNLKCLEQVEVLGIIFHCSKNITEEAIVALGQSITTFQHLKKLQISLTYSEGLKDGDVISILVDQLKNLKSNLEAVVINVATNWLERFINFSALSSVSSSLQVLELTFSETSISEGSFMTLGSLFQSSKNLKALKLKMAHIVGKKGEKDFKDEFQNFQRGIQCLTSLKTCSLIITLSICNQSAEIKVFEGFASSLSPLGLLEYLQFKISCNLQEDFNSHLEVLSQSLEGAKNLKYLWIEFDDLLDSAFKKGTQSFAQLLNQKCCENLRECRLSLPSNILNGPDFLDKFLASYDIIITKEVKHDLHDMLEKKMNFLSRSSAISDITLQKKDWKVLISKERNWKMTTTPCIKFIRADESQDRLVLNKSPLSDYLKSTMKIS